MVRSAPQPNLKHNPGVVLGTILGYGEGGRDKVTLYHRRYLGLGVLWVRAVAAESTGVDGWGLIPH